MIVDDRLETVLRTVAAGPGAAATQMRQLIDLLGRTPAPRWTQAHTSALARIDSLVAMLGEQKSALLIGAESLRSPTLVEHLAEGSPKVALAAITAARLQPGEWLAIIPDLPVQARGFLRHRRDLGADVEALLSRLGVTDFALPLPAQFESLVAPQPAPQLEPPQLKPQPAPQSAPASTAAELPEVAPAGEGIGAIIARIEAFRRAREAPAATAADASGAASGASGGVGPNQQKRLPFAEEPLRPAPPVSSIDLVLDAEGLVMMADTALAPAFVGLRPFADDPDACASCDPATLGAARARVPITGGRLEREGDGPGGGAWRIDAVPRFTADSGHFTGWHARLRRPPAALSATPLSGQIPANDDVRTRSADRLRQMLHELRTPINAIQGFAELIQQQMLGPTPHQYRSLSASIAADAARMLAGFEDVERLAQLEVREPGAAAEDGAAETDLTALLGRLIVQLEPLLVPRQAALAPDLPEGPLPVAIAPEELERTLWRLLALVASAASPGDRLPLTVRVGAGPQGFAVRLTLPLPPSLAAADTAAAPVSENIASPGGMLGSGFALRLCAAELRAAGGIMVREDASVLVTLPLLTAARRGPSQKSAVGNSPG